MNKKCIIKVESPLITGHLTIKLETNKKNVISMTEKILKIARKIYEIEKNCETCAKNKICSHVGGIIETCYLNPADVTNSKSRKKPGRKK
jgi:hypothetical protein